jgi:hypothetical protein
LRQVAAECSDRLDPDMRVDRLLTIFGAAVLAGCWDARPPQFESLVSTAPPNASCVLIRAGQPIASVEPTPAIAMIEVVPEEVVVQCRRPGFADAAAVLPPRVGPGWGYAVSGHPTSDYQRSVTLVLTPLPPSVPRQ